MPASPRSTPRGASPAAAAAALALALGGCGGPEVIVENDAFGYGRGSDRNYSSGFRLLYAMPREEAPEWAGRLADSIFWFSSTPSEALVLSAGHNIYTPDDLDAEVPDPADRPYAAWLYGGIAAYDAEWDEGPAARDRQKVLEVVLGLIGPNAFGEEVQTQLHEIVGLDEPQGWDHQLDSEVTAMLSFELQNRLWRREGDRFGADAISHLGTSAGTPYTMAGLGLDLRYGYRLPRDFGVSINEPALVTTAAVNNGETGPSIYVFAGVRGRVVAWNTFLDGNAFTDSPSVEREPVVGDLQLGAAWQHGPVRLHYTFVYRTAEFDHRNGDGHVFGSVGLSWTAD